MKRLLNEQITGFCIGLGCGLVSGFALMLLPVLWLGSRGTAELYISLAQWMQPWRDAITANLQGSVLPFMLILLVYLRQLFLLRRQCRAEQPDLQRVVRHEQLLDLCANLFFGTGVIWTAIGMRDALLYALGDPGSAASQGAFAVLQRMVDGGILLALSTTIVGGIGGYLMRATKSLCVGPQMNHLYMRAAQQPVEDNLASLRRIEDLLEAGGGPARSSS